MKQEDRNIIIMSDDLVKRLRDPEHPDPTLDLREEAADRIEELTRQLSLVNNTLSVTLSEEMTVNWREFCEAIIEETKEILGETK